ncbi:metallophosphoesterase [Sutcliffiella rhizosphaerae]|uniref:3',5'-cyclic adenosine monophosphate phosphodiesterase CpdA n=1 Tax=Sutcliffiella rhizosphaerae TaxID=2880967 RepID=A0ABM8YLB4_9BACI|nr:metallophosphoesterase [Sutcliffiella rhizosphaerae]CAG9620759.1 3',5'-cyclic adenosine monophosphate phosphodiesterase CpdA [Sutcliffiella rhizosphaerae]
MFSFRNKIWIVVIIILILYTVWDNNRIKVVEQEIEIDSLPADLQGFTILQVTDLHEKEFGKDQIRLIKKLNSIEYDVIAFTGDMLNRNTSQNYRPFYQVIEGLKNKEHALFVSGNSDPRPYILSGSGYKRNEFITGMEERGVTFLASNYPFQVGGSEVAIVDFENAIINDKRIRALKVSASEKEYSPYVKLQLDVFEENQLLEERSFDLIIALNHYPVADSRMDVLFSDPHYSIRNFDLLLAGHYHGGQYRLPLLGAFFVPEAYIDRNGFFPPQDRVKGLWNYRGLKQYVSTGLGSSDTIPFLKFRLFNSPEVNVITFVKKEN